MGKHGLIKRMENGEAGFTLFEIVIALGVLSIGILGVLSLFPVGLDAQKRAVDYSNVMNIAEYTFGQMIYQSHLAPLAAPSSVALQTFSQNPQYRTYSDLTLPDGSLPNLIRVDLYIYSVNNANQPVEKVVSYIENP